jgi:hypothetical protein
MRAPLNVSVAASAFYRREMIRRKRRRPAGYFGGQGPAYGATAALPRQIITRSTLSSGLSE